MQPTLTIREKTFKYVTSPYKARVNIENTTCGCTFQHNL